MNRSVSIRGVGALCGLLWILSFGGAWAAQESPEGESDYVRAKNLLAEGIYMEAADLLTAHVTAHPEDDGARLELAMLLFQLEEDRAAAEQAGRLYEQYPDHAEARRLLIRIRSRFAQHLNPDDPDDLLFFAQLARQLGNLDRAAQTYQRYFELTSDPDALLDLAHLYNWNHRPSDAAGAYRDYLAVRPEDYRARQELARLLNSERRHAEAIEEIQLALKQAGRDLDLEMDLGRSLQWNGEPLEAIEVFRRILQRQPGNMEAHLALANLYHLREQYMQAHAHHQRILRLDPRQQEVIQREFEYSQLRLLDIEHYRDRLRDQPDDAETRRLLIQVLTEQGRLTEALQEMRTALTFTPDDDAIYDEFLRLRARQRAHVQEQVVALQQAQQNQRTIILRRFDIWLRYQPDDLRAQYRWAQVLIRAKRVPEAVEVLRKLAERAPHSRKVRDALVRLDRVKVGDALWRAD